MNLPLALIPPIQIIVDGLKPVLIFIHDTLGVSWGFSIVLLTILVRAAMAPLTVKQFKSMQAMVSVAPQLKELQAKYKDDKQRQQQEVMKFYAENKINPFASCLPLVAQLPFFIGLFYLLQSDLRNEICGQTARACGEIASRTGDEKFLFVPDLTNKATGWVLAVLIVLYIGSQLLSSLLTPSTADRNQRMLMLGLPFVFTFFIISFPAGLIVYWITTNLWTVGQGWILRRKMGPIAPPKLAGADGATGGIAGGMGGFGGMLSKLTSGAAPANGAPEKGADKAPAKGTPKGTAKSTDKGAAKGAGKDTAKTAVKTKPSGPPPRPPRQKKKRSGRRR